MRELRRVNAMHIALLHQHSSRNAAPRQCSVDSGAGMRRGKEARVLPSRLQCFKRLRFIAGCNDYFKESLACRHRFGGGYVHSAAERNDAAECSHRITAPCVFECRKHRISDRCATGVRVLNHRAGSTVGALRMQVLHQFQSCGSVQQVVVRKRLAMQELRAHHAWPGE